MFIIVHSTEKGLLGISCKCKLLLKKTKTQDSFAVTEIKLKDFVCLGDEGRCIYIYIGGCAPAKVTPFFTEYFLLGCQNTRFESVKTILQIPIKVLECYITRWTDISCRH